MTLAMTRPSRLGLVAELYTVGGSDPIADTSERESRSELRRAPDALRKPRGSPFLLRCSQKR